MDKVYKTEDEYHADHKCCPNCGSTELSSTYVGYIFYSGRPYKEENRRKCGCGWEGITHDMVKE